MKVSISVGPSVFHAIWTGETATVRAAAQVGDVLRVCERWPVGDPREVLGKVTAVDGGRVTFAPDSRVEYAGDRMIVKGWAA